MKSALLWLPLLVAAVSCQNPDITRQQVADAATHFTLDLFKEVVQRSPGNVIMSPLSVQTLLAMLQQGARNDSSVQLEKVTHVTQATSRDGFATVIQNFQKRKYKSKLQFANKMFVNGDFSVLPEFNSVLHTSFNTQAEQLNKDPAQAAQRINDWVAYNTKNRITELVTQASITSRTQLVLANVIYFKGTWMRTFDAAKSHVAEFSTSQGQRVNVPMMSQSSLYVAGRSDAMKAQWVELPYDGDDFSMIVILPTEPHGLTQMINRLQLDDFKTILSHEHLKEVNLKLPRFRLDEKSELVQPLQKLGLQDVFNQKSNLEGVSVSKTPLVVSDVLHRAEIEVTEEGTEASAASAIFVNTLSLAPEYEKVDFIANQPFVAVIVDKVNKMPLFVMRVVNPVPA